VTPLTPSLLVALRAVLDRLIPADEFPGALAAGTDDYVACALLGDSARDLTIIIAGLARLDALALAHHSPASSFAALSPIQQDELLRSLDVAGDPFFQRLVDLAHEGFYADPGNGGNRDALSWQMLGYDPRGGANRPPTSAPVTPTSR
jgi:hypothetical protein